MNKKTKFKNKDTIFLVALICLAMFFSIWRNGKADSIINLNNESSNCKLLAEDSDERDKCEELEKRAKVYREIIDIKRKQGETLNDQLSITTSNITQVQNQIDESKQKIDDYNSQISRIERQIMEKEALMESQKKVLAKLIQSYYEVNLASPAISYLNDGNIASFIVKKDRIAQTGDKIKEMVDSVKNIKIDLENQIGELDEKKRDIVLTNEQLEAQNSDLEAVKDQREDLLAKTKGEEARYQQLLARVESQKQELLNIDQLFSSGSFNVGGLSASEYIRKNDPPSSSYASTSWFYSQKDPRWANVNIGNSNSDMKNWGCAVTSVAMVAKFNGDNTTPGSLAKKPIFSFDLINWNLGAWSSSKIELSRYGSAHRNISWSVIDSFLKNKKPVIIYIGKSGGKGGHYVVIHTKDSKTGKYVVHDPYFGSNLYLETSRALVGAMGTNTSTYMDQMIIYE